MCRTASNQQLANISGFPYYNLCRSDYGHAGGNTWSVKHGFACSFDILYKNKGFGKIEKQVVFELFFKSMLEFEHSEEFRQKKFKILIKSQNFLENSKQDAKNLNEKLE